MAYSNYRGEEVVTTLVSFDGEEPTLYCVNDDCPGLEVLSADEVSRLGWSDAYVAPSRLDAGYSALPYCPRCGQQGHDVDELA